MVGAQRGNLFQPRPIFVLEHHAGGIVHHDLADHRGRKHHRQRQRIILQHPGNIVADRFDRLLEIARDLIVGAQMRRRRDHHPGRARIHRGARQRAHRGESRRGDADDDLHVPGALHEALCDFLGLRTIELGRLAQNAEHGDAVAADLGIEVGQPVDGFVVDAAVIVERRRRNGEGACGFGGELCHVCLYFLYVIPGRAKREPGISRFRVCALRRIPE